MIKFFRHIRKTLIQENKMGKYFKYALGEIVLVVIGILIALQVNNWSTEFKNREKETLLLKQIHRDFTSNKIQLDSITAFNHKMNSSLNVLIQTIAQTRGNRVIDTLLKYGEDIVPVKTFNPSSGSVESIVYSSSLELIKNDSLRNLLVSWKDVYNDYSEEEQFARNFQTQYLLPFFRKRFNYLQPYSEENLNTINTFEFQNIWLDKQTYVQEVLKAAKEEQIEHYINEILRLTADYD